jgi:sirohydrochlorin cobaltochelatase
MFRVVEIIRNSEEFDLIEVGFLECNSPTIPEAIDLCAAQGATHIFAVPYFLHTGTHVAQDLPSLLLAGQERHPHILFRLGDFLGCSPVLTTILAERVEQCFLNRETP